MFAGFHGDVLILYKHSTAFSSTLQPPVLYRESALYKFTFRESLN